MVQLEACLLPCRLPAHWLNLVRLQASPSGGCAADVRRGADGTGTACTRRSAARYVRCQVIRSYMHDGGHIYWRSLARPRMQVLLLAAWCCPSHLGRASTHEGLFQGRCGSSKGLLHRWASNRHSICRAVHCSTLCCALSGCCCRIRLDYTARSSRCTQS